MDIWKTHEIPPLFSRWWQQKNPTGCPIPSIATHGDVFTSAFGGGSCVPTRQQCLGWFLFGWVGARSLGWLGWGWLNKPIPLKRGTKREWLMDHPLHAKGFFALCVWAHLKYLPYLTYESKCLFGSKGGSPRFGMSPMCPMCLAP